MKPRLRQAPDDTKELFCRWRLSGLMFLSLVIAGPGGLCRTWRRDGGSKCLRHRDSTVMTGDASRSGMACQTDQLPEAPRSHGTQTQERIHLTCR